MMNKNKHSSALIAAQRHTRGGWWLALPLACAVFFHAELARADAQLMVSPTRVLFDGNTRTAEVNLINSGTSTGTFRVTFERKQMTEEGAYKDVPEGESGMFADPYVRFSPRQVTLAPGKSQTVRLMLRKPADLPEGEYRSHMLFQAIPDASTTRIDEQVQENPTGVSVRLIPILGISIPVLVRNGNLSASASLSQVTFHEATDKDPVALSMMIERSGNSSVYGDLVVGYQPKGSEQRYVVGLAKGVAVLTPNPRRTFKLRLQPPDGVALGAGTLEVSYRQPEAEGGRVLATAQTTITAK